MAFGLQTFTTFNITGSITSNVLTVTSMGGTAGITTSTCTLKYGDQILNASGNVLCTINGFSTPSAAAGTGRLGTYPVSATANIGSQVLTVVTTTLDVTNRISRVIYSGSVTFAANVSRVLITSATVPALASLTNDDTWGIFCNDKSASYFFSYSNPLGIVAFANPHSLVSSVLTSKYYLLRY